MPRFYSDIRDGQILTADENGAEFASAEAARRRAMHVLADIARQRAEIGAPECDLQITIRGEDEGPVLEVRLTLSAEAVNQGS